MRSFALAMAVCWMGAACAGEAPVVVKVWPKGPPGGAPNKEAEKDLAQPKNELPVRRITNVGDPTIHVYPAPADKATGAAVLIAPGGGYHILAWDKEGEEVATWLNGIGVTGILLKYRVPRPVGAAKDKPPIGPLQDGQRALRLARSKAKEWNLDPKRIGMLGFSAGGHLAAAAATNFNKAAYDAVDKIDEESCRPDFAVLVYPGYLVEKNADVLSADIKIDSGTPPLFFAHAHDDGVRPENSVIPYLAAKKAQVPAELHVYSSGGHGFGLRPVPHPCAEWPTHCAAWMKSQGFLKRADK